ncbi:MAG: repair protein SbcD/Mre11 [Pseudonocardiales bacterium]|jgi:exonuclease SbcD|nr:repair protein SbcD/Mre11 [Pseudonocardiales bacterium]
MRILHTSDWHLGRTLHGEPLIEHQRQFLAWLVQLARDRHVDAVVVAGDVYDRAVPPTDAVQLLDEVLVGFSTAGIPVVLTSGNHDSAIRLGFGSALHAVAGVHLRTRLADLTRPVLLRDGAGEVAIYGIPYLLPDAVMAELDAERTHTAVLCAAVDRIRRDAAARGVSRVVAVAHAFVTGARPSESERDIRVGGIGDAPASVFAGLTYAALGHLHGPQQVAPHVRYSGSPLAFSFSERGHTKSVAVVEIDAAGDIDVDLVPIPVGRALREVRGRLDDLLERAATDLAGIGDAWVKAVLTDATYQAAAMERLRGVWPHTIVVERDPEGGLTEPAADRARVAGSTDPIEICSAFVEWVDSTRPTRAQRDTLHSALEAVAAAEASA